MNVFNFKNFTVLIDYAHNTAGMEALGKFIEKIESPRKVGIITGVGDRRDEDIKNLGVVAARVFDEIIIRQDRHLRGRNPEELVEILKTGIFEVSPNKKVQVIYTEIAAIENAIKEATPGSYITICTDIVPEAVAAVLKFKEIEDTFTITSSDIPNLNR